jgi:tetratricopeptide (TPR) repeat protein
MDISSVQEAGNDHLKRGRSTKNKAVIEVAITKYSEGLAILSAAGGKSDPQLLCALCSNRAFAESLLGNWRNAFDSAMWAIRVDSTHLKSYFRAASAAQKLRRWNQALKLCSKGLELDPGAEEFLEIQKVWLWSCPAGAVYQAKSIRCCGYFHSGHLAAMDHCACTELCKILDRC